MHDRRALRYKNSLQMLEVARQYSPGGAQTLSKRAESFVEGAYPCYIQRADGAYVVDVDGHPYLDFICGLGTQTLGYANTSINAAVMSAIVLGVNCSLPYELEVRVARKFIEALPDFAEQVRFVKTGSEACAAAARLARMHTGREVVLYSGYHGWHDGYTSTRPYREGIPTDYRVSNQPLAYNNLFDLDRALQEESVAAVMLEPTLLDPPDKGYLEQVVQLCHEHGALAIFDEMICSGRWALAGGCEYFRVEPDLAIYGKFLGQGYPLAAVVGRKDIMQNAWVVSGTFGGELTGLAAADVVLDLYNSPLNPITQMWELGDIFLRGVQELIIDYKVPATIYGYPVHPKITFTRDEPDRTNMSIFLQEMAMRGVLFHPGGFNISAAMTEEDIRSTLEKIRQVFTTHFWHGGGPHLLGQPWKDAIRANT